MHYHQKLTFIGLSLVLVSVALVFHESKITDPIIKSREWLVVHPLVASGFAITLGFVIAVGGAIVYFIRKDWPALVFAAFGVLIAVGNRLFVVLPAYSVRTYGEHPEWTRWIMTVAAGLVAVAGAILLVGAWNLSRQR